VAEERVLIEEKLKTLNRLRVYAAIESPDLELNKSAADFIASALRGPVEIEKRGVNVALTFNWSLLARVAKFLEEIEEEVLDLEVGERQTVLVTSGGLVITISTNVRQNAYVFEIEGYISVDKAPFHIEES